MEQKQPDPFFKVIVRIDGRLQGAIYNLTKVQATQIAERINDRHFPEVFATASEMATPLSPRVVGTSVTNEIFLEKHFAAVVGYLPNR